MSPVRPPEGARTGARRRDSCVTSPQAARAPTIVCVDDDTLVLRSLREQIQRGLGRACAIELAGSGEEALALLDELAAEGAEVPLLISDQIMPGLHGAQFLAKAHQRYPDVLKVMLTGQADAEAVGQAVNQADLYRILSKPWQEHDLLLTVREALRRVEQERTLKRYLADLELSHREMQASMQLLIATMDATLDGLLVLDRHGDVTRVNRQFAELWSLPPALAEPGPAAAVIAHLRTQLGDPACLVLDPLQGPAMALHLDLLDGRRFEYLCRPHRIDGEAVGMVYSFRDVTERERSAALIRRQALHDPVTGLPNRYQFDDALALAVAQARRTERRLAVLFIDLDHFKQVNDTLGHALGDEVLLQVAQRLQHCVRGGDLVARWGGDEFTILLPSAGSAEDVATVVRRVQHELGAPLRIGQHTLQITASIGAAAFPDEGGDATSLLKHADLALYRVKAEGRNGFRSYAG